MIQLIWTFSLFAIQLCLCKTTEISGSRGGSITIEPIGAEKPVTSVLWKVFDDKVAEYDKDPLFKKAYRNYDKRTEINEETGSITISGLIYKEDDGLYSVEVNHKLLDEKFNLKIYEEIGGVDIKVKKVEDDCVLTCEVTPDDVNPPWSYRWSPGDSTEQSLTFKITQTNLDNKYICNASNPANWKSTESANLHNCKPHDPTGSIVGGILGFVALAGIIGTALYMLKTGACGNAGYTLANRIPGLRSGDNREPVAGNGTSSMVPENKSP